MTRLVYVCNVAWFFVSHRLAHAEAARRAGYEVHVASAPDDAVRTIEDAGIAFHPVPFDRKGGAGVGDIRAFLALRALYGSLRPHLVHHVTMKPVLLGSWAARTANVPAVVNAISGLGTLFLAEGVGAQLRRQLALELLRLACAGPRVAGIFQNEEDRRVMLGAGIFDRDRTVLIPGSGVDLARFRPAAAPAGQPVVVLPARMLRDKGVVEFASAARQLAEGGVRARFALVGGSDPHNASALSREELEALAQPPVEWWGHRTDMPDVLSSASVVCLPSYREGLPKALAEAAAAGRPIVTTDVPGCRDVVEHGVNGFIVPPRDPVALARAIGTLLADAELRERFGRASRARAEASLGLESVIQSTLSLYERLLVR